MCSRRSYVQFRLHTRQTLAHNFVCFGKSYPLTERLEEDSMDKQRIDNSREGNTYFAIDHRTLSPLEKTHGRCTYWLAVILSRDSLFVQLSRFAWGKTIDDFPE